jgi:hypothetical protein
MNAASLLRISAPGIFVLLLAVQHKTGPARNGRRNLSFPSAGIHAMPALPAQLTMSVTDVTGTAPAETVT